MRRAERADSSNEPGDREPGCTQRTTLVELLHQTDGWPAFRALEEQLFLTGVRRDLAGILKLLEGALWEAIGRAFSGPLEDIERAQRYCRRALECNPLRSNAREALADTSYFDPASHCESVAAHRDLSARHPAGRSSWRSLERIAVHWKLERVQTTCTAVPKALRPISSTGATKQSLLVDPSAAENPSVASATELQLAIAAAGSATPTVGDSANVSRLSLGLRREVESIAGAAWALPDGALQNIWTQPVGDSGHPSEDLRRRALRRLKRALRSFDAELLSALEPEACSALAAGAHALARRPRRQEI